MKLSQAFINFTVLRLTTAASYYPDWEGGSQTCLSDGAEPLYMTKANLLKDTLEDCCAAYYNSEGANCIVAGGGTPPTGSLEWYVNYEDGKCEQDCPAGTGNCGGYATPADALFADETLCCETKLGYLAVGFCEAESLGNSYAGSGDYYVDYVNGRCVMDCDEATPGCGGIATTAAFTLYADAATCCSEKLGYLNADVCASNSNPASTGTGKYFANVQDSICVNDETGNCPTGETCAAATDSEVLYDTIEECCAGSLGWVTADYCVSRSDGTEYSTQWFVDYSNEICVQDCQTGATCGTLSDATTNLYDSALECCEGKLTWVDSADCDTLSQGGTLSSTPTYTDKFYVNFDTDSCVQDCDAAGGAPCGGNPPDASLELFDDAATCCSDKLPWVGSEKCIADTNGVAQAGSTNFYVDWGLSKCVQDCSASDPAPCGGFAESWDTTFATAAECCDRISWVPAAECVLA
ncbi:predicted protein [Thalassiosira pseudonana CCMP1335]|uniref:Uncharacterized protein n=1 Tax=Thalassiosira pseudonana TaxID=35128 RepID=B5YNF1_THAPS|nr:predicted protein [Thalassiosira pseudonana CCMP1335]ACI64978.1 predicted protein [Thalassiosira pseudonana CCMP1335]